MNIELTAHARRILPWIIEQANAANEMTAFNVTMVSAVHAQLWDAVNDPIVLANITVHELQRCGVCAHFANVGEVIDTHPDDAEWLCLQPEQAVILAAIRCVCCSVMSTANPANCVTCMVVLRGGCNGCQSVLRQKQPPNPHELPTASSWL